MTAIANFTETLLREVSGLTPVQYPKILHFIESLKRMALYLLFWRVPRLTRHALFDKNMSFFKTDLDLFSLNRL